MSAVSEAPGSIDRRIWDAHAEPSPSSSTVASPLLPPYRLRTAREENRLRMLHWNDIATSQYPNNHSLLLRDRGVGGPIPSNPWLAPVSPNAPLDPVVGETYIDRSSSVTLSRDGGSDRSQIAGGKGPRVLAREAEGRPANELIRSQEEPADEEEDAVEVKSGVSTKRHRELEQHESDYGGDSGRTARQAASESTRRSGQRFRNRHETEGAAEVTAKTGGQLGQRTLDSTSASGELRAIYGDASASAGATVSRAKGNVSAGAKAEVGALRGDVATEWDGPLSLKVEGRAASAQAHARGNAEYNFSEGTAALEGSLGADAVVAEAEFGAEWRISPRRAWNSLVVSSVNTAAEWLNSERRMRALDTEGGWDIILHGSAGGSVGLAGGVTGQAHRRTNSAGVSGRVKAAALLGVSVGGGVRVERGK